MEIEVGGLFGLLVLIADIWAILNIAQARIDNVRKLLWILLIILLPLLGVLIWWLKGPGHLYPHLEQAPGIVMSGYIVLFWSAFGAATILPFYSEVVLVGMLGMGLNPAWLWLSATVGNTLGAVVNWAIGWRYVNLAGTRWLPMSEAHLLRAQSWFDKYGYWTLLLSWMPIGGDALTFIGGIMRIRILVFLLLVGVGKGVRYAVIIGAYRALPDF